jgi:hypothetical protein
MQKLESLWVEASKTVQHLMAGASKTCRLGFLNSSFIQMKQHYAQASFLSLLTTLSPFSGGKSGKQWKKTI